MKKFEEDETETEEKKSKDQYQANPENMKKLQCLESSEASSKLVLKTFMSDTNYARKLSSLASVKQKEESKNNNINDSQTETNNSIQKNIKIIKNKDIIVLNTQKKKELSKENRYEINIVDYIKVKFIYSYYKYGILIYDRETNKYSKVYRRYSEFENLRKMLINKYVCVYAPPLPGKIFFNFLENNLAEKRKKFLQIFLHELQYLIYYFYDSSEIKEFLDPKIDYFNYNLNINVSLLLKQNINESFQSIVEFSEISKKTFVSHLQNIHDKIILKLRENDMNMKEQLTDLIIKNYPPKIIEKDRYNILKFTETIENDNKFNNILIIKLKNIKKKQKKYYLTENNFYNKINSFMENYENNLNNLKNLYEANDNSSDISFFLNISCSDIDYSYNNSNNCNLIMNNNNKNEIEKYLLYPSNRHYYKFLKNIYDWILREVMINNAYIDSFTTLNYFEDKLKDVKDSIKRIKMMKHKISKKEDLEKYIYMNKLLNKIIILNTIYLKHVRIERYKYSRFQLYYNSLKFAINKIQLESDMKNKILSYFFSNFKDN